MEQWQTFRRLEYLADPIAAQHDDELMGKTTSEFLLAILSPAAFVA
jgi:hypothetical protein